MIADLQSLVVAQGNGAGAIDQFYAGGSGTRKQRGA